MKQLLSVAVLCLLFSHSTLCAYENTILSIQSEIEGLAIEIDEKPCGITIKNGVQTFEIEGDVGTGGFGSHKAVVQKEINATHEYYGEREFKYKPFEPIIITEKKLQPRLKRALLATQNGLLNKIQLQHHYATYLEIDDKYLYVLTQSRTKVYSKRKREKKDAEYLEIYDKHTLSFVKQIVLNEDDRDSYDREILLHQRFLYITSKNGEVIYWEKDKTGTQAPKQLLSHIEGLNKLRSFGKYLFRFGQNGFVEIYQNNLHVKTIDTKQHRFKGYETLKDKRFDRIFDVLYTNETLFIANDLGEVQVYSLTSNPSESSYITTLRDLKIKDAYDVLDLASHGKTTLVVGADRHGIYLYDIRTLRVISHMQAFVSQDIPTKVYRMQIVDDTLVFMQGLDTPHIYAYGMKQKKIIHDFQGEAKAISDFHVNDKLLFSIDDGNIYIFSLDRMKER